MANYLTWYHHQALMDNTTDTECYLWYAAKTFENGWSRNILVHQADTLPSAKEIERRIKSKYDIRVAAEKSGGSAK